MICVGAYFFVEANSRQFPIALILSQILYFTDKSWAISDFSNQFSLPLEVRKIGISLYMSMHRVTRLVKSFKSATCKFYLIGCSFVMFCLFLFFVAVCKCDLAFFLSLYCIVFIYFLYCIVIMVF